MIFFVNEVKKVWYGLDGVGWSVMFFNGSDDSIAGIDGLFDEEDFRKMGLCKVFACLINEKAYSNDKAQEPPTIF